MTDRRVRIIYAIVGIALTFVVSRAIGTSIRPSLSASLWFEILIWIIVAAFVVEPNFSGPSTALVNAISVVFITLGAGFRGPFAWWVALFAIEVLAVLLLVTDYALRDPNKQDADPGQRLARTTRQVAVALGSWRFSLVAALALALVAFNPPFTAGWPVSVVVLLYVFAMSRLEPHKLVAMLSGRQRFASTLRAERVMGPAELVVTGSGVDELAAGNLLSVRGSGRAKDGIVIAPSYIQGRRAFRVYVPELPQLLSAAGVEDLSMEKQQGDSNLSDFSAELQQTGVLPMGTVSEGSTMLEMAVELFPDRSVELGQVLWTRHEEARTYWQVVGAKVERNNWGGDSHRCVTADTVQLGQWDQAWCRFESVVASPSHTNLAFGGPVGPGAVAIPAGLHRVATVPQTDFPILVDLKELSLYHAALLGTTGTGKTHLSFALAEALSGAGVKMICVDTTGQYSQRFPPPSHPAIDLSSAQAFLNGPDTLAVFLPNPNQHAVREGKALAELAFNWAKAQAPRDPDALARCVIVFEEAQNFVPEQFVVDDWKLKATAQDTARLIMESRKFGLGFILISQRTAMVTKSALSQCNTIVAFQAVDQTGLEYLEALCGRTLASGIPTLPVQTAITMGRGMASTRPIIARIDNAQIIVQ